MSETAQTIAILTPTLTAVGGAIGWLWNRIEKRFKEVEVELAKCRKREKISDQRRAALITIIELLWRGMDREAPESAELHRVQKLMDDYKAIGMEDREDEA